MLFDAPLSPRADRSRSDRAPGPAATSRQQPSRFLDSTRRGGGVVGQAEAVRTALARGIVEWHNDPAIKDAFLAYDRTLLVNDSRQKETKKPHGPGARARFQKSYR